MAIHGKVTQVLSDRGPQKKGLTAAEAARERFPQEVEIEMLEMRFEEWQEFGETRQ